MTAKKPQGHKQPRVNSNGQFTTDADAARRPQQTSMEIIPFPGFGDSGRYPAKPAPKKKS